jgi:hypothetical protein
MPGVPITVPFAEVRLAGTASRVDIFYTSILCGVANGPVHEEKQASIVLNPLDRFSEGDSAKQNCIYNILGELKPCTSE